MAQILANLNPADYEHEMDKAALDKVKKIPLVPKIVNFVLNWTVIRSSIIAMCGTNFHVTKDACPDLFNLAKDVTDTLDMTKLPDLYMQQGYYINAYTTGHQGDAYIVVSTGAVDKLTEEELKFVIGHETGHIKSGHVLYHVMAAQLGQIIQASGIPIVATILGPALLYWNRMSEFTADRAGLLACQDLNVALSAIMKMSGLPEKYYNKASIEGFMKPAKEFDIDYSNLPDTILKFLDVWDNDHPWTIRRAAELIKWYDSGEYDRIIKSTEPKICPVCGKAIAKNVDVCPMCGNKKF
ncbi:MAG: M48 family metalloprotease [Bacteroidales bacterium]|nr:M48 family metalloprotease [Bacteroidales bacterium]